MNTPTNSEALPPTTGSASEAEQQAPPTSLHEIIVTGMVNRLRRLADDMEETGEALQLLENYVDAKESFKRGSEMKGAADMAREWATEIRKTTSTTTDKRYKVEYWGDTKWCLWKDGLTHAEAVALKLTIETRETRIVDSENHSAQLLDMVRQNDRAMPPATESDYGK